MKHLRNTSISAKGVDPKYNERLKILTASGIDEGVNADVWKSLGLSINSTLEDEFWSGKKGNNSLSISISGDTISITYRPSIRFNDVGNKGYWSTIKCDNSYEAQFTDPGYTKLVARLVAGFKLWGGSYNVQGRNATVNVFVDASVTSSFFSSHVAVDVGSEKRSGVPGSAAWSVGNVPRMFLYLDKGAIEHDGTNKNYTPWDKDYVQYLAAHEFGHVLGLADAYGLTLAGIEIQPVAPANRANDQDCIMWNQMSGSAKVGNTEIEMLLYAWKRNKAQGYSQGLIAEESQAFFH